MRTIRMALILLTTVAASRLAIADDAKAILVDERTPIRYYIAYEADPNPGIYRDGLGRAIRSVSAGEGVTSPPPADDWMKGDFDDRGWCIARGPVFDTNRGYSSHPWILCHRARFHVSDPAAVRDLKLTLNYGGALCVYVNGEGIAADAMGTPRPTTAPAPMPQRRLPLNVKLFETTLKIPSRLLRAGTNVLAIELRQEVPLPATTKPATAPAGTLDPTNPKMSTAAKAHFNHVGVASLRLEAAGTAAPNTPPANAQVWVADPLVRVGANTEPSDPLEGRRPVLLSAPRNGFASGQVVVTSPADIHGVRAKATPLTSSDGATLPAPRVRYARIDRQYQALYDEPCAEADAQRPPWTPPGRRGAAPASRPSEGPRHLPIWLAANVPPDAKPGTYKAALAIEGLKSPVSVPIELRVYDWQAPPARHWRTYCGFLQSPESVAGYYKVPMWSDRHFALIEKSFELMALCGSDCIGVNAVANTVYGNDPLIVFRKENGKIVPEFKFMERYLSLYDKHCGQPMFLCVQVWHYGMSARGVGRDGGNSAFIAETIPVMELVDGKLVNTDYPMYGRPGTEELWRAVFDGIRQRVAKLGWKDDCLILGTSGDGSPNAEIVEFLAKVAPGLAWRSLTHGNGCPKWGGSAAQRTQPNGMVVRLLEFARRLSFHRVAPPDCAIAHNARDDVGPEPFALRSLPICNIFAANGDGFCWKGIDYWTYTTPEGTSRSALNTYVHFGNMVGTTPRTLAFAGPDGALTTTQLESLRQGTLDCEAMLYLRSALRQPSLRAAIGDALAARIQKAIEQTWSHMELGLPVGGGGGGDVQRLAARIYELAAEVSQIEKRLAK